MHRRAIFLCGDRSRYGRAHLLPLLRHFDLQAVITPDPQRWQIFYRAIKGVDDAPRLPASMTLAGILGRLKSLFRNRNSTVGLPSGFGDTPHHIVADINSPEALKLIEEARPTYLFAAAYPQIFSPDLLQIAERSINFHPSALPAFRGAHPHYWTIATGAAESGVTAHLLTEELDAGDIVAQRRFPAESLYYTELYDKIVEETAPLVEQVKSVLTSGEPLQPQDHSAATVFRNDREIHHRIFWDRMSARKAWNLVRTERAYCFAFNHRIYLQRAEIKQHNRHVTNNLQVPGGTVVDIRGDSFVIAAGSGFLKVTAASTTSGRQNIAEFVRRSGLRVGVVLT